MLHLQKYLKYLKPKKYPTRAKAAPKPVGNQSATKAMASDSSDMDVDDYYVIEDANESDSSEYVPCINYANDKVYPEDVKMVGLGLSKILAPNIYRFEGSYCHYLNLNNYTQVLFLMSFLKVKCGQY